MINEKKLIKALQHLSDAVKDLRSGTFYYTDIDHGHSVDAHLKDFEKSIGELLLKYDESKQPQPPISQTPMLGEVPHVVNDRTEEKSKAVEGATPVVGQNEQTKKVCPHCSDYGWIEDDNGLRSICPCHY